MRLYRFIMAGAGGGRLETFKPDLESVTVYLERVELYFCANEVKHEKQIPVFLNLLRRVTYALLQNLVLPVKPAEKNLNKLMDALRGHAFLAEETGGGSLVSVSSTAAGGRRVSVYLPEL